MKDNYLESFVIVNKGQIISPVLITIRSYGDWFEKTFDNYTAQMELYMKAKTKEGESVLEYHPGTRIGKYFDSNNFTANELHSWFILQDSNIMYKLVKSKLAEQKDAIPISVNDPEKRRMLRVYTKEQIELYLRTLLKDKNLQVPITTPKQIKVVDVDLNKIIKPDFKSTGKRKLF